jgi:hyperosmotically inducible periplasmic protein
MATQTVPVEVRPDRDLAIEVEHAIDIDRSIPGGVHAQALNGEVTLTGRVHFPVQKVAAEQAARSIPGVRTVTNLIEVKPDNAEAPDDCC